MMKFSEMLEEFPNYCTWKQEDEETGRLFLLLDYSAGPEAVAAFEIEIEPDGEAIDNTIVYAVFFEGLRYIGCFDSGEVPEKIFDLVEKIAPNVTVLDLENL